MKRTWIAALLVLLVILSAMPAAASNDVAVLIPRANENLEIGVPALIMWEYRYYDGGNFKIVLMQNNIELGIIAENFPYTFGDRFVWNAGNYFLSGQSGLQKPLHAGIGTGYSIKFQTMNNSFSAISGRFTLSAKLIPPPSPIETGTKKPLPGPSIKIISPTAGGTLNGDPGGVNVIKWTMNGKMNPNVSVTLLYKGAVVATLAASTPNNGTFNWNTTTNPVPYRMGGPCTLRVRTLDGRVEALSGEFPINHIN